MILLVQLLLNYEMFWKLYNSHTRRLSFMSFLRWDKVISEFPLEHWPNQFSNTVKARPGIIQPVLVLGTRFECFFHKRYSHLYVKGIPVRTTDLKCYKTAYFNAKLKTKTWILVEYTLFTKFSNTCHILPG